MGFWLGFVFLIGFDELFEVNNFGVSMIFPPMCVYQIWCVPEICVYYIWI